MALGKSTSNIGEALSNTSLPATPPNVGAQVSELGGVKAVAAIAGRSASSVYRWLRGENKPNPAAQGVLDQASSALRASTGYRRAQLKSRREKRFRNHGSKFRFKGVAGPKNDSPKTSVRPRDFMFDMSAEGVAEIMDAWLDGGDEAALDVLGDVLAGEYMNGEAAGWEFQSITLLNFSYSPFSH